MSDVRLFDVGPDPEPVDDGLGQDARRTARRRALLNAGIHPTTKLRLREPAGETCGTCNHHEVHRIRSGRTFHKCNGVALTHGPGSDVRVGWPACTGWAPVEDAADG